MYLPSSFRSDDPHLAEELMARHGFATLVTSEGGALEANHVPVLLDRSRRVLRGHVARANPVWRGFAGATSEVLAIFHGPHCYVSPSFYVTGKVHVPTWNYAVVHVHGVARLLEGDDALASLLTEMVSEYEGSRPVPWHADMTDAGRRAMLGAIVGFEIPLTRVETKLKLSQNRDPEDRDGVIRALRASASPDDRAVAELMERVAT